MLFVLFTAYDNLMICLIFMQCKCYTYSVRFYAKVLDAIGAQDMHKDDWLLRLSDQ
jgi:hypothetical protein